MHYPSGLLMCPHKKVIKVRLGEMHGMMEWGKKKE